MRHADHPNSSNPSKIGTIFLLLVLPYAALYYLVDRRDILPFATATAFLVSFLCLSVHVYRNRKAILEGIIASIVLLAILSACALIPVVGWIADAVIILYALSSVFTAVGLLMPLALRAAVFWAAFFLALLPEFHHPVLSPLAYLAVCAWTANSLARKADPYGDFILGFASIPLLGMVIVSLGKMFRSDIGMRSIRMSQNVSGYTTRAGVQVGDYTRTVTRQVVASTTSLNPGVTVTHSAINDAVDRDTTDA